MQKGVKHLISIVFVVCLVFVLSACTSEQEKKEKQHEKDLITAENKLKAAEENILNEQYEIAINNYNTVLSIIWSSQEALDGRTKAINLLTDDYSKKAEQAIKDKDYELAIKYYDEISRFNRNADISEKRSVAVSGKENKIKEQEVESVKEKERLEKEQLEKQKRYKAEVDAAIANKGKPVGTPEPKASPAEDNGIVYSNFDVMGPDKDFGWLRIKFTVKNTSDSIQTLYANNYVIKGNDDQYLKQTRFSPGFMDESVQVYEIKTIKLLPGESAKCSLDFAGYKGESSEGHKFSYTSGNKVLELATLSAGRVWK